MSVDKILLILGLSAVNVFDTVECVPFAILRKIENNDASEIHTPFGHTDQKDVAFVLHTPQASRNMDARFMEMNPRSHAIPAMAKPAIMPQFRNRMIQSGNVNRISQAIVQNPQPKQLYVPIEVNPVKGATQNSQMNLLDGIVIPRGGNSVQLPDAIGDSHFQLRRLPGPIPNFHQLIQDRANPLTTVSKSSIIIIGQPETKSDQSLVIGQPNFLVGQPSLGSLPSIQNVLNYPLLQKISPDPRDVLIKQLYSALAVKQHAVNLKTNSPLILMNGALEIASSTGSGSTGSLQNAEIKQSSGD